MWLLQSEYFSALSQLLLTRHPSRSCVIIMPTSYSPLPLGHCIFLIKTINSVPLGSIILCLVLLFFSFLFFSFFLFSFSFSFSFFAKLDNNYLHVMIRSPCSHQPWWIITPVLKGWRWRTIMSIQRQKNPTRPVRPIGSHSFCLALQCSVLLESS